MPEPPAAVASASSAMPEQAAVGRVCTSCTHMRRQSCCGPCGRASCLRGESKDGLQGSKRWVLMGGMGGTGGEVAREFE